jgi:hypothetical protein
MGSLVDFLTIEWWDRLAMSVRLAISVLLAMSIGAQQFIYIHYKRAAQSYFALKLIKNDL